MDHKDWPSHAIPMFRAHLVAAFFAGRDSSCGSKIKYNTKKTAWEAANAMSEKYNKSLEAYPCPFCTTWHVGRLYPHAEIQKWKRVAEVMFEEGLLDYTEDMIRAVWKS